MNKLWSSIILGILFLALSFAVSLLVVVAVKWIYITLKRYLSTSEERVEPSPPPSPKPKPKRVYKPVRSIEINPEEIDRIIVKK